MITTIMLWFLSGALVSLPLLKWGQQEGRRTVSDIFTWGTLPLVIGVSAALGGWRAIVFFFAWYSFIIGFVLRRFSKRSRRAVSDIKYYMRWFRYWLYQLIILAIIFDADVGMEAAIALLAALVGLVSVPWAYGVYLELRERIRHWQARHRFLCPHCLRFSGFHFACRDCGKKVVSFIVHTEGDYVNTCPHCQAHLFSRDGVVGHGVRAYCEECNGTCDRSVHHERQIRALATLLPTDAKSLCYDDGVCLTYLLNLSALTDTVPLDLSTHALSEVEFIWLDTAGKESHGLALEVGQAADRLMRQFGLTEAQQQALTVCVPQAALDPIVEKVLMTRFGTIKCGVAPSNLPCDESSEEIVSPKEGIGHYSTVSGLIAMLKNRSSKEWEKAVDELVEIGQAAVPALIAALKDRRNHVFQGAAEALGRIRHQSAVPALIPVLKSDSRVRRRKAAEVLGGIGDNSAVPALLEALEDNSVREHAAVALGRIGDPSAVAALKEADGKYHRSGFCSLCEALHRLGVKEQA
jgi:hypothetical protein